MANGNRLLLCYLHVESVTNKPTASRPIALAHRWKHLQSTGGKALVSHGTTIETLQLTAHHVLDRTVSSTASLPLWTVNNTAQETDGLDQ